MELSHPKHFLFQLFQSINPGSTARAYSRYKTFLSGKYDWGSGFGIHSLKLPPDYSLNLDAGSENVMVASDWM